ncbi:MAG: hypothetical protein Q9194_004685 [Teloschistes cf. exilis]
MAPSAIISLAPFLDQDQSAIQSTAASLISALQTSGFLYLTDAPIPTKVLAQVYELSTRFFVRPLVEKNALAWDTPRANRGYSKQGFEKVSLRLSKEEVAQDRGDAGDDQKESFEIGRDDEEGYPNKWPKDDREFKMAMLDFFERCRKLHAMVMKAIAIGLGLDAEFFADYVKHGDNTLRLLHYPGVPPGAFDNGRVRAGLHSDYGSVTFLFQDNRGGLQVERRDGSFTDVTPIEGTIVLNAGDLLSRWSNGMIRSTRHRVVEPPLKMGSQGSYPPRYSVAYFCNPDFDKTIEALPGTFGGKRGEKKFDSINSGEYLEIADFSRPFSYLRTFIGWHSFGGPGIFMTRGMVVGTTAGAVGGVVSAVLGGLILGVGSLPFVFGASVGFMVGLWKHYQSSVTYAMAALEDYPSLMLLHLDANFPLYRWKKRRIGSREGQATLTWTEKSMLATAWQSAGTALEEIHTQKENAVVRDIVESSLSPPSLPAEAYNK